MYEGKMPMHKRLAAGENLTGKKRGGVIGKKDAPAKKEMPMKKGSSKGKKC